MWKSSIHRNWSTVTNKLFCFSIYFQLFFFSLLIKIWYAKSIRGFVEQVVPSTDNFCSIRLFLRFWQFLHDIIKKKFINYEYVPQSLNENKNYLILRRFEARYSVTKGLESDDSLLAVYIHVRVWAVNELHIFFLSIKTSLSESTSFIKLMIVDCVLPLTNITQ